MLSLSADISLSLKCSCRSGCLDLPYDHHLYSSDDKGITIYPNNQEVQNAIAANLNGLPTRSQLANAASISIISESGVRIPFSALWEYKRTVVLFIRHFMCPMCQDYIHSLVRDIQPSLLEKSGLQLVIISNGHFDYIRPYRKIFQTPFAVFTDPGHAVYRALGMTLQTLEGGKRPSYVRHGLVGGIGMAVKNAVKTGMPLWKSAGDITQLGGEFILGPGLKCEFAHRMDNARGHMPIMQVLEKAAVIQTDHPELWHSSTNRISVMSMDEMEWMTACKRDLSAIVDRKAMRRGGWCYCSFVSESEHSPGTSSPQLSMSQESLRTVIDGAQNDLIPQENYATSEGDSMLEWYDEDLTVGVEYMSDLDHSILKDAAVENVGTPRCQQLPRSLVL